MVHRSGIVRAWFAESPSKTFAMLFRLPPKNHVLPHSQKQQSAHGMQAAQMLTPSPCKINCLLRLQSVAHIPERLPSFANAMCYMPPAVHAARARN